MDKKCSGIKGKLLATGKSLDELSVRIEKKWGKSPAREMLSVVMVGETLQVAKSFCYLEDMLKAW